MPLICAREGADLDEAAGIAGAVLVPEATMAQRLVRAKRKIRLCGRPARLVPSPVVELNRAVVMADGPAAGLVLVRAVESSGGLEGHHLPAVTRADLVRRLGSRAEEATAHRRRWCW
ncbi:hypothetical protein [Umezawaea sp.]|uniref:hypothetical protein n=1 Tax=Umezawaea sp. TaxID=1955258 RepID=UPI002ED31DF6